MPYKDIEKRKQWAHEYIRRTDVKIRRSAMKNKKYAEDEEYREKIKKTAREWQRKKRQENLPISLNNIESFLSQALKMKAKK